MRFFQLAVVALALGLGAPAHADDAEIPTTLPDELAAAFSAIPGIEGKEITVAEATPSSWLSLRTLDRDGLRRAIVAAASIRGFTIAGAIDRISDPERTLPGLAMRSGGRAIVVETELDGGDLDLHVWSFDIVSHAGTRFDIAASGQGLVRWNVNKLTSIAVAILLAAGSFVLWRTLRAGRASATEQPAGSYVVAARARSTAPPPATTESPPSSSRPRIPDEGIAIPEAALAWRSDVELDPGPASFGGAGGADRTALPGDPVAPHVGPVIRPTPPPKQLSGAATAVLSEAPAIVRAPDSGLLRICDRYRVTAELGRGAMGVVYRAFDEQLEREVAIKALGDAVRGHPEAYKLFASEAKALAQLHHQNLVALFDRINDGANTYLVMELVEGQSLDRVLVAEGCYGWRDALLLTYHLCAGLAYAHGKNVIHRDIKPANIFIMPDGQPKLGDFGLARVLRELVIRSTEIRGTPLYMAPEQITGTMIDHRADLYAVGCTLFEVITGRPPFTEGEILYQQLAAEPPRPSELVDGLPAGVERLILDLLAKAPDDRPPTAQDVRDRIRAIVA